MIFVEVEKRDKETITDLISKYVHKGPIIYTDKWKGYNELEVNGYQHWCINHSKGFKRPNSDIHTNTIEGTWSW